MLISPTCSRRGRAIAQGVTTKARAQSPRPPEAPQKGRAGVPASGRTSFSTTATRFWPFCRRMWLSSVVLPAPRKPVTCARGSKKG